MRALIQHAVHWGRPHGHPGGGIPDRPERPRSNHGNRFSGALRAFLDEDFTDGAGFVEVSDVVRHG